MQDDTPDVTHSNQQRIFGKTITHPGSHALRPHDNRQSIGGPMEITPRYKVISGASAEIEQGLNLWPQGGWGPLTMSSLGRPSVLTVILENKIMEEANLPLSRRLEESMLEEVQ